MRKTISLICTVLLASALSCYATSVAKTFKQNAKTELSKGAARHKVPVEIPLRKQLSTSLRNVTSTARLSSQAPKANLAPLFAPEGGSNIYGWLNYYNDASYDWDQVGLNQVFTDGTYSTIFKCWDSPSMAFYHDNKVYTLTTEFDDMASTSSEHTSQLTTSRPVHCFQVRTIFHSMILASVHSSTWHTTTTTILSMAIHMTMQALQVSHLPRLSLPTLPT